MEKKRVIGGILLIAFGLLLLGQTFGWFDAEDLPHIFLPAIIILVGVWLIMRKRNQPVPPPPTGPTPTSSYRPTPAAPPPPDAPPPPEAFSSPADSHAKAVFSGGPKAEIRISSEGIKFNTGNRASEAPQSSMPGQLKYSKFLGDMYISFDGVTIRNVEVSSGLGEIEINLRGATLSPGLNRLIVSNFLGDIRVLVPHTIEHFVHLSNFAGDTEAFNRRSSGVGNRIENATPNYEATQTKLYIAVNSFAGSTRVILI